MQVLQEGSTKPLAEHMTGQQYAWMQGHLGALSAEARRVSAPMMASFLTGCSEQGFKYSPDFYGCLVPYKEVYGQCNTQLARKGILFVRCCLFPTWI